MLSTRARGQHLLRLLLLVAGAGIFARAWQPQNHHPSNRRQAIQSSIAAIGGGILTSFIPQTATAAEEDFVAFEVAQFSFEIPKSWKVIVKPNPNKSPKDGKVFSALDLGTGAVLTVVQEQICSKADYALMEKQCDLVAGETAIFGEETFSKDVTKLLRRHDDRDNAALQGTTVLDRVERDGDAKFQTYATTSIPTGGTYRDRMGLDQPFMITRNVQSQVRVVDNAIISLWLSAPSDEWRKPLVGTKLLQVWASVQ